MSNNAITEKIEESKPSLLETNAFLKDPETREQIIETVTESSAAVEGVHAPTKKAIINIREERKNIAAARMANLEKAHAARADKKKQKQEEQRKLALEKANVVLAEQKKAALVRQEAAALDKTLEKTSIPEAVRREIIDVFYQTGGQEGLIRWIKGNKKKNLVFYYKELLMPALKMASDSGKPAGPAVHVHISGLYPEKTMVNIIPTLEVGENATT